MKNEVAVSANADYPVLSAGADFSEVVRANLGGGGFSAFDLERIKMPTGGGKTWAIPSLAGEESRPMISGIIALFNDVRAYWADQDAAGQPPDCSSTNTLVGVGNPGGQCENCPHSQWDSGKNERGQACKAIRRLFLLRPKTYLPALVALPPTSLKACRQYMMRITNAALPYWRVVTEMRLTAEKNPDGLPYSQVIFSAAADAKGDLIMLTEEEGKQIKSYAAGLQAALAGTPIATEDYVITNPE